MKHLWLLAVLIPLAQAEHVIVRPTEIHGVLVNPGMGITTFQRYNGEPLYPGLRWSEAGPTEPLAPVAAKPVFPETTIAYGRWHWATLEPERGKVRWEILDTALQQARLHGQTLALRRVSQASPKLIATVWIGKMSSAVRIGCCGPL